jgi:hypothetical protein
MVKTWKQRFEGRYEKDIENNNDICKENRDLFIKFFDYEKDKLKRSSMKQKGGMKLDEPNYNNMYNLITRLLIIERWFKGKAWVNLTEKDIQQVYDDLCEQKILRNDGKPYDINGLAASYFNKIMKSKPFELAGKAELCRKIIKMEKGDDEVRYCDEENFKKILLNVYKPIHHLLFWLQWDYGENINTLLRLKKSDFREQKNPDTEEPEYHLNLRREILKRSRKARGIISNYPETVKLLNQVLKDIKDDDFIFNFEYATAKKIINRAVERSKAKCIPKGEKITWKDLRSGMACDLLKKGWTTDEINSRLGHKPSSSEIDKYVNTLAIDMHRPKKKVEEFKTNQLKKEIEELKEGRKLEAMRNEDMKQQLDQMNKILMAIQQEKND